MENYDKWKKETRSIAFWVILFLGIAFFATIFPVGGKNPIEIDYSTFLKHLDSGDITKGEVVVNEGANNFIGYLRRPYEEYLPNGKVRQYDIFKTTLPPEYVNNEIIKDWQNRGIEIMFVRASTAWLEVLGNFFPWILLLGFWIYLFRMQGGGIGKNIFSFGKSRARRLMENESKVTFDDVAGIDEAKQELQEIIEFLRNPPKLRRLGGKIRKGVLLQGPPGDGKTLLAKAVAGEAGVPFFSLSGADFVEMFVGVGAARVRDLFEQAKKNAPCIIFIDEIDAIGRQRGVGQWGLGHNEGDTTLNQLLVEMDGFDTKEGVVSIAATNRPDVLDKALLRSGRFDRQIVIDRPDVKGREGILKVHCKNIPLSEKIDLNIVAKNTPGFSGAQLASMVNEAALLAARRDKQKVEIREFEDAKDKILMGSERPSLIISEKEKRVTAYHEAGHVIIAMCIPFGDEIHKATIIPRGRSIGKTTTLPIDDDRYQSKSYLESVLTQLMGGIEAETLIFNETTTGAGDDLAQVTDIAQKMVCEWGMSQVLGRQTFSRKQDEGFSGREISKKRDYSEKTAYEIDAEVKRIIDEASERARKILQDNLSKLHLLANTLVERETLTRVEIEAIIEGEALVPESTEKMED